MVIERYAKHSAEMREAGLEPIDVYPGSNNPWKCKCLKCGLVVYPRYYTVVRMGKRGCNYCAKAAAGKTRSDSASKRATEAAKTLNLKPLEPYPGSHKKWLLECEICGARFSKVSHAVAQGKGCVRCATELAAQHKRAKDVMRAYEAFEKVHLRPLTGLQSLSEPWAAQCLICGNLCSPRPASVIRGGSGCAKCSFQRRGFSRRVNENDARLEMITAGILPDAEVAYPGTSQAWAGKCLKCGLPTKASLGNIRQGHLGCRRCAMVETDSSFDFFGPAIFYLISKPGQQVGKVGIAGTKTKRLEAHRREGWNVDAVFEFEQGFDAWYLEGSVLAWLRGELALPMILSAAEMPQGGFTETFSIENMQMDEVSKKSVWILENKTWSSPQAFLDGRAKPKARRTCTLVEDQTACTNVYYSSGFCRKHYTAWIKHGDPLKKVRQTYTNKTCSVVESGQTCGAVVTRKGMCSVHYQRDYEHGDPLFMKRPTPQPLPTNCIVDSCQEKPVSLGRCSRHYHAHRRALKSSQLPSATNL